MNFTEELGDALCGSRQSKRSACCGMGLDVSGSLVSPVEGDVGADAVNARLVARGAGGFTLLSSRPAKQEIEITADVLSPGNTTLARLVGDRKALFIVTPNVDRLYGGALRHYIESVLEGPGSQVVVLDADEATKNMQAVEFIVSRAREFGLGRDEPLVALGGGVCSDIVGVSGALYRRGVPSIKVPTTLVGLIDAGIGTKNAVNHHQSKSAIGTFSSPEASLLDPTFLRTLPERHLRSGLAEMLKMAVICDRELFALLEDHGRELVRSKFQAPAGVAMDAIRRSVSEMLRELSSNLYERSRRRVVDFGHTFSPYVEMASGYRVIHGEAVAIDIAISSEIAATLGLLRSDERDAILDVLADLGLPHHWLGTNVSDMFDSLTSIRQHRGGHLHLVVPSGVGSCAFLEDDVVSLRLVDECVRRLSSRRQAMA